MSVEICSGILCVMVSNGQLSACSVAGAEMKIKLAYFQLEMYVYV